jgi:ActR/RegA family two-component response regulator
MAAGCPWKANAAAARDSRSGCRRPNRKRSGRHHDGTKCARRIRARRRDIACILMTGYGPDTLDRMGVRPGDTVILRKPIRLEDLHACLANRDRIRSGAPPPPSATLPVP